AVAVLLGQVAVQQVDAALVVRVVQGHVIGADHVVDAGARPAPGGDHGVAGSSSWTFGPTASTRPKPSWPITRKSYPGGAAPYSAALISLSVPSTPTRKTLTSTPRSSATSSTEGLVRSARWTLFALPGNTLIAFISSLHSKVIFLVGESYSSRMLALPAFARLAALLQYLGNETGPTRLMARANASAGVAVEILVKQNEIVP